MATIPVAEKLCPLCEQPYGVVQVLLFDPYGDGLIHADCATADA